MFGSLYARLRGNWSFELLNFELDGNRNFYTVLLSDSSHETMVFDIHGTLPRFNRQQFQKSSGGPDSQTPRSPLLALL
jgi:hypothetical protein